MNQETQKPRARAMALALLIGAILSLALFSAFSASSAQAGNGTADEILVYNRGSKTNPFTVTQSLGGFVVDNPPPGAANANWTSGQYAGFAGGTLYFRARIVSIPKNQVGMKLGFCFWQQKRENCKGQRINGVPGTEQTWSFKLNDMWKKNGQAVNWATARTKDGFSVRNAKNKPVSDKGGFGWSGENPANWYPMNIHYTVVLVKAGGTFDGWQNYGW
jgi:hypothetical protein